MGRMTRSGMKFSASCTAWKPLRACTSLRRKKSIVHWKATEIGKLPWVPAIAAASGHSSAQPDGMSTSGHLADLPCPLFVHEAHRQSIFLVSGFSQVNGGGRRRSLDLCWRHRNVIQPVVQVILRLHEVVGIQPIAALQFLFDLDDECAGNIFFQCRRFVVEWILVLCNRLQVPSIEFADHRLWSRLCGRGRKAQLSNCAEQTKKQDSNVQTEALDRVLHGLTTYRAEGI